MSQNVSHLLFKLIKINLVQTLVWPCWADRRPDCAADQRLVWAAAVLLLFPLHELAGGNPRLAWQVYLADSGARARSRACHRAHAQLHGTSAAFEGWPVWVRCHEGHCSSYVWWVTNLWSYLVISNHVWKLHLSDRFFIKNLYWRRGRPNMQLL